MTESTKVIAWKRDPVREKHFKDFTETLRKLGLRSDNWDGKRFWPAYRELGHSSVDFKSCKCYNEHKESN